MRYAADLDVLIMNRQIAFALFAATAFSSAFGQRSRDENRRTDAFYATLTERMCVDSMTACAAISRERCLNSIKSIRQECPFPNVGAAEPSMGQSATDNKQDPFMLCYRAHIVPDWKISIEQFRACRRMETEHDI